eukprot:GFUD01031776.1.p1 GENE.GFUD01031776.1~~GFUD01031776.1.p1  ORF type:complete len:394 (+),score=93.50 GFUD01031776.1:177-1358(+)
MLDMFLDVEWCWRDQNEREIRRINSEIERQIRKDKREAKKQYKILLLGAGESGKSTFIRHMRIIHGEGFGQKEREEAREIVVSNLVICIYIILSQMDYSKMDDDSRVLLELTKILFTHLSPKEEKEISQYVYEFIQPKTSELEKGETDNCEVVSSKKEVLDKLWHNYKFRETLGSLTIFKLPDSALYFLSHFERILEDMFIPTAEDMIRMRQATTGVQETLLPFGDVNFRLVDVGGQRSERKKWIHCFEDVSSIIFIASLAEYNLHLVEDASVNRLEESIALFKTILKNPWLQQSSVILFLNKKDIFDEKIQYFDLRDSFEDYHGKYCDSIEAKDFILDKFVGTGKRHRTTIYSHITIATDPDNVRFVFAAVKHTILSGIVDDIFSSGSDYLQ